MEKGERFESVYKFYTDGRKKFTELIRLKPTQVFCGGFFPPLIGSVAAIGIALVFHNDEISNYNWQCGRLNPLSVSRYNRLLNVNYERKRLYHFMRYAYLLVGLAELFFLAALSIIGERENIRYDVFAICEYAGVFLNIAYHGCAFFDIRYKVVFSVRLVETIEPEESANRLEMKKPSPQEETVK
ncbi:hypothetical protein QR680_003271 [Steinernema hermaphroditum]|uniref:Post-GPI attachment to proteins factor 2 n=1 Tax=Steinernema hermaphroditum TaxID=289476 RepID=A0AA39H8M7_9BILA|nr:hypothetical protein QR680_003271 [Steinernema hermaphroditum]